MTQAESSSANKVSSRPSWWRRSLVEPIRHQLTQGATPSKLAWAAAVGVTIGIIPLMGTVSLLSVFAAAAFKLNQAITHLFTRIVLPLHIGLIIPFIRLGQRIHGAELLSATVPELVKRFGDAPMQFLRDFGLAAWHGFVAWLLVAPLLLFLVKWALTPIFTQLSKRASTGKEASA